MKTCSECDRKHMARGLCSVHYDLVRRQGAGFDPLPKLTRSERLWSKVNKTDTCWLWTAAMTHNGYGVFGVGNKRLKLAHRLTYEEANGPIPPGLWIDHLCRVRHCVRPDHLEAVTPGENIKRGWDARKNLLVH